jgi:predicted membrane protein
LGDSMQNNSTIDIQLAIGDVVLRIPKEIWVNLHYKHLFGTLNLNDFGSKWSTDFVSKNISQAKKTIDINVNMWFSKSFTVVRY